MWMGLRHAPTAITDTRHTLAHPMATMDLAGSRVDCLSAPVPGMAGGAAGAAVGATDTMAEAAGVTVVAGAAGEGTMAMRATPDAAILDAAMPVMASTAEQAASTAEQAEASTVVVAAEASTAEEVEDSMAAVAAASTAAVVMAAAADTDNRS